MYNIYIYAYIWLKINKHSSVCLNYNFKKLLYAEHEYNFSRLSFGQGVLIFSSLQTNIKDQNLAINITGKCS